MEETRKSMEVLSNKNNTCAGWSLLFKVGTKYVPVNGLGKGSYGVVCSAVNRETNERVAIKKIKDVFYSKDVALRTLREVVILKNVRHENVIALKDIMITSEKYSYKDLYLVYELMEMDLYRVIASPLPLSNNHIKYLMFQLLRGLQYLHSRNILHRDLKPENILVNSNNWDLKICDFGLSRFGKAGGDESMTEYTVTRWYRAPEILLGSKSYDASIDIWSVGCILAELLGRQPLFRGKSSLHQLRLIIDTLGSPKDSDLSFLDNQRLKTHIKSLPDSIGIIHFGALYPYADFWATGLLQKMLVFNPWGRITVTEALEHPYMSDLYNCVKDDDDALAHRPLHFGIDSNSGEPVLRELLWQEMLYYRPQPV